MQTDWAGEYQSLNSFFQRIGISHRVSCPHAHQQNGAAERKHRHIIEMGLALLANASMPLKFWDEAFLTVAYLINLLPSRVISYETPVERLFHIKPYYTLLRTLGCAVWPNPRPYNTKKLNFRSTRCMFLGYNAKHKGYKCLEPSSGRVYISRDVVFDESIFPFSELHPNARALLQKELLLLPNSSLFPGDVSCACPNVTNLESELTQEEQGHDAVQHGNLGAPLMGAGVSNPTATENPTPRSQVDPPTESGARSQPDPVTDANNLGAPLDSPRGETTPATYSPSVRTRVSPTHAVPSGGPTSAAPPVPATSPAASLAGSGAVGGESPGSARSSTATHGSGVATKDTASPPWPRTRLQSGIVKPKQFHEVIIRYGNFCSTGEPENIQDALDDPR